jgi:hypothetical protein
VGINVHFSATGKLFSFATTPSLLDKPFDPFNLTIALDVPHSVEQITLTVNASSAIDLIYINSTAFIGGASFTAQTNSSSTFTINVTSARTPGVSVEYIVYVVKASEGSMFLHAFCSCLSFICIIVII